MIPRLSRELHNELPDLKGFSERNIKLMVQFSSEYPGAFAAGEPIGQPPVAQLAKGQLPVAQIPWAQNDLISNVAALITFLWAGRVDLKIGLTMSLFSVMGHWVGAQLGVKRGTALIRPVMALVCAGLFLQVLRDTLRG